MSCPLPKVVLFLFTAAAGFAQSFAGYDDFSGNDAKWAYFFRPPALTTGTNGVLTFNGSVLSFTKGTGAGSYILGWDADGIPANTATRTPVSFTQSWVAEISATNRAVTDAGTFSSVGFEVAVAPNAYTEMTLERSGGQLRVRTETSSATTGLATVAAPANADVRLRIAWDAAVRVLTLSYSFDAGASYATLRTVPITDWATLPTGGFNFEVMGYSVSPAPIPAGVMYLDDFSITPVPAEYGRLSNLSVRNLTSDADRTLIVGFAVAGEGTRPLVIRAVSETLGRVFGVPNTLPDVDIALYAGNAQTGTAAAIPAGAAAAFQRVGAFSLDSTSPDAAAVRSVHSGTYTVHAVPAASSTPREGVALVEIYEDGRYATRLTNLSARTLMGTDPLIVGFAVSGAQTTRVLVRAVGPGLAAFGITNFVADPRFTVIRMGDNATIGQNNDWGTATGVATAAASAGAFPLSTGSKDAALVLDLAPGAYSVVLDKADATSAVVLAEIYQVNTP